MVLVGKQMVDFTNRDGERVQGIKLHLNAPDQKVQGMACVNHFIKTDSSLYNTACDLPLGDVLIEYGYKGSIQGLVSLVRENK